MTAHTDPLHNADFRALALELSLRTIAILHRESTAHRGFCVECNQEYPCVTNLEASAHLSENLRVFDNSRWGARNDGEKDV